MRTLIIALVLLATLANQGSAKGILDKKLKEKVATLLPHHHLR